MAERERHIPDPALPDWPMRPWVLALLLGIAGLVVNAAMDWGADTQAAWRAALAAFAFFGALVLAFTLEENRLRSPLGFAAICGLVMAGIAWRVARAEDHHADEQFWLAAGVVAMVLALPLFQAGFHRLRWRTSYELAHYHVWTDAISAAGAFAFLGLSWLLLVLMSELFAAIEIDLLRDLIDETWFGWLFSGVAFGAALGTLRNQLKVIGTLQSVVMLVFSLVAVPFAIALIIFLLAVLVSGLDVLWNATQSPTPLLLSCAAACFVLVNAVARNNDAEASANRILRLSGLVLALGILPLSVMAAVSTGTRIAQHGLSPERIWGVIAVAVAVAYGVAYFIAPIRGRIAGWMERVREANLHLAVGTCVLAFVLALPLFDFGALSARNQIARLESGEVPVERFDFSALRWDFGDAGREALAKLASSGNVEVQTLAQEAQAQETRPYRWANVDSEETERRLANLRMQFSDEALRSRVIGYVRVTPYRCDTACVALDLGPGDDGRRKVALVDEGFVDLQDFDLTAPQAENSAEIAVEKAAADAEKAAQAPEQKPDSTVEIRPWSGRRVYIDGKPAGEPFE